MSALPAKPGLRHSVLDWSSNNLQLSTAAQHERHVSSSVRQEGRSLRNEANCTTTWDENNTSQRLSDRIWDVTRWKETLENCAQKLDVEMEALTLSKAQTEQALAATTVPLEVSAECLSLRDGRRGLELVLDPVDDELKKEAELIEKVQQTLQQRIDQAFEQLCFLQEARHQLTADLQNKMEALDIDIRCLSLTNESPQISLKTNPTRTPSGSTTPEEWLQFSQFNVARAQEAMHVSRLMRGETSLTRAQLQNELEAQHRATAFALRKRKHHEEQARDELQWQLKNTDAEISEMDSDIQRLDADLQAKTACLKLAHTRLENRTSRPGVDLCKDEVQLGLVGEVQQLEASITALKQKLSEAQLALQRMSLHRARMSEDLSRKQEALFLEQRTTHTRSRLSPASSGEKNLVPLVPLVNSSGRSNLQLLTQ